MILINFSLEPVETKVNYEDFFKLYIFQCKSECSIFTYYKLKLIREYKFIYPLYIPQLLRVKQKIINS